MIHSKYFSIFDWIKISELLLYIHYYFITIIIIIIIIIIISQYKTL